MKMINYHLRVIFNIDQMNEEEKKQFMHWYEKENDRLKKGNEMYNLCEEMKKYCYDDCYVLSTTFGKCNESMIKELKKSGIDGIIDHQFTILADFVTLPQMVIHWYVGSMMPKRSLSIVPHGGYDNGKCGSLKENVWLAYLDTVNEEKEGANFIPICSRYSTGQKQKRVGKYFLDGFGLMPDGSRECYEFYDCYYHGCPKFLFSDRSKVICHKFREYGYRTVEQAYVDTIEHEMEIKIEMGFSNESNKWIVIWEHEYNEKESIFKNFLDKDHLYDLVDKLNPRDEGWVNRGV